jgi:hypothetical protein
MASLHKAMPPSPELIARGALYSVSDPWERAMYKEKRAAGRDPGSRAIEIDGSLYPTAALSLQRILTV